MYKLRKHSSHRKEGKERMKYMLLLLILIFIMGCGKALTPEDRIISNTEWRFECTEDTLPDEARVIKRYSRGWVLFKLDGNTFLAKGCGYILGITQVRD